MHRFRAVVLGQQLVCGVFHRKALRGDAAFTNPEEESPPIRPEARAVPRLVLVNFDIPAKTITKRFAEAGPISKMLFRACFRPLGRVRPW